MGEGIASAVAGGILFLCVIAALFGAAAFGFFFELLPYLYHHIHITWSK